MYGRISRSQVMSAVVFGGRKVSAPQGPARNVARFVTVGQGLKKLKLVRDLQTYGEEAQPVPGISKPEIRAPKKSDFQAFWGRVRHSLGAAWKGFVRWISLRSFRFTLAWLWLAGVYVLLLFVPQLSVRAVRYGADTGWAVGLGVGS